MSWSRPGAERGSPLDAARRAARPSAPPPHSDAQPPAAAVHVGAPAVARCQRQRAGGIVWRARRHVIPQPRVGQRPVIGGEQTVRILEPDPGVEHRDARPRLHVHHAGVTAQKTLFLDGPLVEMPCGGRHREPRRRRRVRHQLGIRDADERRPAGNLRVLENWWRRGVERITENERGVHPVPPHPREIGTHGTVPGRARRLDVAIGRGAGTGPRDEVGVLRRRARRGRDEQQRDELHRATSGSV